MQTHLLSGLPEESYEAQVNSIRKAFEFEFDDIQIFSIILLPEEMESAESRKNTRLKQSIDLELEVMGNIMVLQQLI